MLVFPGAPAAGYPKNQPSSTESLEDEENNSKAEGTDLRGKIKAGQVVHHPVRKRRTEAQDRKGSEDGEE